MVWLFALAAVIFVGSMIVVAYEAVSAADRTSRKTS